MNIFITPSTKQIIKIFTESKNDDGLNARTLTLKHELPAGKSRKQLKVPRKTTNQFTQNKDCGIIIIHKKINNGYK